MKKRFPGLLILAVSLSACSGSDDTSTPSPQPVDSAPAVNAPVTFTGNLIQPGEQAVSRFLKNGLYAQSLAGSDAEVASPSFSFADTNHSVTNTQEAGVDEADRLEYDGEFLYYAAYPAWYEVDNQPYVRVMQRQHDQSFSELTRLPLATELGQINGLYLDDNRLAVINSSFPIMLFADIVGSWGGEKNQVTVSLFNTSSPDSIEQVVQLQMDGWLLGSRRIEKQLYLVTSSALSLEGLIAGAADDETKWRNYNLLQSTDMQSLMPRLAVNGQSRGWIQAEDCLIPEQAGEQDGYSQLLIVTRINMDNPQDISALCMTGQAENLYMSAQNLYLAGTVENQTVLHKVALSEPLSYQASGLVDGTLGWQANPYFRLSEHDNHLRVVSSDYSDGTTHRLNILAQQGQNLALVSQLPNDNQPEAIGKPGEDIYSVRYLDDRAYIVTFERTDPLYILDLSNPLQPMVEGSLELPGFSSYLHPLENNYLLGIGQDVSLQDLPGEDGQVTQTPVREGMKVSLFDINDPAHPIELASIARDNSFTPVEFDHKALSVLKEGDQYRFAMPVEHWQTCDEACTTLWAPGHSLMLVSVDASPGMASLSVDGQLQADDSDGSYHFGGADRSLLQGDNVYYLHGNQLWHAKWTNPDLVSGPY
ncbi:beta-propeller domain-containing protein [Bowmanella dokdonensis]|uniref:Beta-propeller domain-containing protein n=1 Tax=Bowmanella dokdonensis TaxID=751969 RepID=A0A939DQY5_9ALTE|nr:beta-propeller domain-containing protein [Bowmanella dokdonensis]MBN7827343.1 beta-propeller domain-containing protein [Bowmanella dokdonensis]